MKIIYSPEGGSKRTWEFDPENPPWDVTYGTEKATDWPWEEFTGKLSKGSAIALQALIYVLRKRDEPRLLLDAVTPSWAEVDVEDEPAPEVTPLDEPGKHSGEEPGEA